MMDQIGLGKVISINGPSFSGKTYFIHSLLEYLYKQNILLNISVNSFELVYDLNLSYEKMIDNFNCLIEDKIKHNDVVIAESTVINIKDSLTILLYPYEDMHIENYTDYMEQYGLYDSLRRSCAMTINKLRKSFVKNYNKPKEYVLINDKDYSYAFERVIEYVGTK